MNWLEELSKEISYALRHAPWEYELEMDEEGWVPVAQLLDALHMAEKWKNIGEADLSNPLWRMVCYRRAGNMFIYHRMWKLLKMSGSVMMTSRVY